LSFVLLAQQANSLGPFLVELLQFSFHLQSNSFTTCLRFPLESQLTLLSSKALRTLTRSSSSFRSRSRCDCACIRFFSCEFPTVTSTQLQPAIAHLICREYVQLVLQSVAQLRTFALLALVQPQRLLLQHVRDALFVLQERESVDCPTSSDSASPDPLKASIFVVAPPSTSLSQLFVHLLVLFVGFVPSAPCTGAFVSCTFLGKLCVFGAPFAVCGGRDWLRGRGEREVKLTLRLFGCSFSSVACLRRSSRSDRSM
jgi:hypothetical protein